MRASTLLILLASLAACEPTTAEQCEQVCDTISHCASDWAPAHDECVAKCMPRADSACSESELDALYCMSDEFDGTCNRPDEGACDEEIAVWEDCEEKNGTEHVIELTNGG